MSCPACKLWHVYLFHPCCSLWHWMKGTEQQPICTVARLFNLQNTVEEAALSFCPVAEMWPSSLCVCQAWNISSVHVPFPTGYSCDIVLPGHFNCSLSLGILFGIADFVAQSCAWKATCDIMSNWKIAYEGFLSNLKFYVLCGFRLQCLLTL